MSSEHYQIVYEFYYRSLAGTLEDFDFQEAYDDMIPYLQDKLNIHGLGTEEDFIDSFEGYGIDADSIPDEFESITDYLYISKDMIFDAIMKLKYEKSKEAFEGMGSFEELQDIIDESEKSLTLKEHTILFDRLIHAQHETGDIFDDLDTEDIKQDAEKDFQLSKETANEEN